MRRVAVHVLFWFIVFAYEALQTAFIIKNIDILFICVTLREVVTMIIVHYFAAAYVIPKLLLRTKWVGTIASLVLIYVFLTFSLYYGLMLLRSNDLLPGYITQFANFYLKDSFFITLIDPMKTYNTILQYSTLFFTLLIKTTLDFVKQTEQKTWLENEKIKLEKANVVLELNFLKSQVNPHFFFNTLNNIYSLIEDKNEQAACIILQLSDLMRYTLYESNHSTVPLKEEFKFIGNYVELERIRHNEHVVITFDVEDHSKGLEIPPLLLITFVENAFKHGVRNTIEASQVNITAHVEHDVLTFIVQNSKPEKLSQESIQGGIGLMNVRRRLELLYPNRYQLHIKNQTSSYSARLQINLNVNTTELRDRGRRALGAESYRKVY